MSGLRTASLRVRVTLTAIAVLLVVLPITGLTVKAVFDAQAERSLDSLLTGRAQLAQQLARQNVAPSNLVRRVDADGVRVTLTLRNGRQLGAPPIDPGGTVRQVKATLQAGQQTKGATLLLSADTGLLATASSRLRTVLLISGAAAILITALALVIGMRFALAPLDAMTGLARSIAAGRRGERLQPERADTELGRTAAAFDEMLDALEGAEESARRSEGIAREAEDVARRSEDRMREFVADAAHELRTPVAGLQTAAETLIQLGPQASAERREELELLLVRESHRAGTLVADLLELSRIDAGLQLQLVPVDLRDLADAQAARLRLVAPELNVEVHGSATVAADPERLTQVLANLVDNARQAGAHSVRITIASRELPAQPTAGDHGLPDVAFTEVLVEDDGPGVPPPARERIFARLVHGPHSKGAGLGLAIARGLAQAHGGNLTVGDRQDGKPGAAFHLHLPPPPPTGKPST
ncbi:HAMP domain-containing sensor histidine kinase [Kribbella kalugense]|uniref:histidine kinase n=1 Tax=Kribbella kalugense TaxID=2512221 RepID=A0A4R8A344_9ACTN|nr:HAMP domain-containing sensor histidine kinase [Kribbella kalugense]TDW23828.1 HAMP domain-containing protein [Kribbella kalugense]